MASTIVPTHAGYTRVIHITFTACMLCRNALHFTWNSLACGFRRSYSVRGSAFVHSLLLHRLQCLPFSFPPGFIHHARVSTSMYDVCTRTTPWRVTTRNTMTLIHGAVTCTIARLVCTRARRPTAKGKSGGDWEAREEGELSRSRLEIARENKERCAGAVSSLFSASVSSFSAVASRDPLLARRNFFSRSKASRGNTPSRSNSFLERAKIRVKINYECFLVAIFMGRRISDVFTMKIATVCVVRGEYHGDRKLSTNIGSPAGFYCLPPLIHHRTCVQASLITIEIYIFKYTIPDYNLVILFFYKEFIYILIFYRKTKWHTHTGIVYLI